MRIKHLEIHLEKDEVGEKYVDIQEHVSGQFLCSLTLEDLKDIVSRLDGMCETCQGLGYWKDPGDECMACDGFGVE